MAAQRGAAPQECYNSQSCEPCGRQAAFNPRHVYKNRISHHHMLCDPHKTLSTRDVYLLRRLQLEDDVRAALDALNDVPNGQGLADS